MARNDNRDKQKPRPIVNPNTPGQQPTDDWNDESAEAEAKTTSAENAAQKQAQLQSTAEADKTKESFFDKAVGAVKHALHIDEPQHLSHATPRSEDPEHHARIKEAHRVELGDEGEFYKEMPINKVPGKLRKFVSNN
jgi:hypothetical protein